ncbi:MAG: glycosyltransferase [Phycisphaerae bacterium]|nr:glycosyltransferase [Phycisphaerae bacterium]
MAPDTNLTISVVIPAYNVEQCISRTIESVLAQTHPADEIIVIDDGSTDNTVEVVRSFGDKVILIEQENAGASLARNNGIKAAKSQWIAFLDADDEWLEEKLELQIDLLKQNPNLDWITGNYYLYDTQTAQKTVALTQSNLSDISNALGQGNRFNDFFEAYMVRGHGHTDTMLIKRELLIKAGMFDVDLPRINDYDMWLRVGYLKKPLGFVLEPTAIYHTNISTSIVSTYKSENHFDVFISKHLKLSENHGLSDKFTPCAKIMLKWWIGKMIHERNGPGARILLKKYGYMVDSHFRKTALISSYFPVLANLYNKITNGGIIGKLKKMVRKS